MSVQSLRSLLADVEASYLTCWDILETLKDVPDKRLLDFQPILCDVMLRLARANARINQERRELLRRQKTVSKAWFKKRQKALSEYQNIITHSVWIGKVLGDAFAWFFYQNERKLLSEHIKHDEQKHLPIGLGGDGELEFIKGVKEIDGHLVLYHGTTNLLRIGDFSLIDLTSLQVVAIGELKTGKPEGDQVTIRAILVGSSTDVKVLQPQEDGQPLETFGSPTPEAEQRLQRQVELMSKSLATKSVKTDEALYEAKEQLYVNELAILLKEAGVGRFTCRHAGGGLVLVAYRSRKSSLYNKVSRSVKISPDGFIGEFSQLAVKTCCASNYNSLIIGSLMYSQDSSPALLPGTIPAFWWDVGLPLIKQMVFQEVMVLTIFNPAILLAALEAKGFKVITFDAPNNFVIELEENDKKYTLTHFEYFVNLIRFALFKEGHIEELVSNLVRDIKAKQLQPQTRVELHFEHSFVMPSKPSRDT